MGKPEDISAPPLTEKDVRRFIDEVGEARRAQLRQMIAEIAREEVERNANLAREVRFAATYGANTEEVRRALAGEPPLKGEYDSIALWNDFYAVLRVAPAPGDNQPKDTASPTHLAFMRLFGELNRLRTIEEARKRAKERAPEPAITGAQGRTPGKGVTGWPTPLSRCGYCDEPVYPGQEAEGEDRRPLFGSGPTYMHRTCRLFAKRRPIGAGLEATLDAIKTIRDHLGFLEEGGAECEKALDIIASALRP